MDNSNGTVRRVGAGVALTIGLALIAGLSAPRAARVEASPTQGGTFRFLTEDLPRGTTNGAYTVRILTANARGPVVFSSNPSPPAPGLELDPVTGLITGTPTVVNSSGFDVTITADDGDTDIDLTTKIRVNSAGGGGNSGASFQTETLPDGEVGIAYAATLVGENTVGPVIFGAQDLPPGIVMNGLSGALSGTPAAPGTYYATFSITDRGENDNKVFTVVPITIAPDKNDFAITNTVLVNGEVGSDYLDSIDAQNGTGNVRYAATGLPAGLLVDSDTGDICGAPTEAGLFFVRLQATDAHSTYTVNLPLWIATSASGNLYWDYFGVPTGIVDVPYGRQPPIEVVVAGAGGPAYSATGLPAGLTYGASTGELSGTPTDVGIYPVVFTATDGGESVSLATEIIVLPPSGGDASSIPVNLWVSKLKMRRGTGDGAWAAKYVYNADRRPGNAFDAATEAARFTLGSREIDLDPATMTAKKGKFLFATPRGETPIVKVQVVPAKQTIVVKTKKDDISDKPPITLRSDTVLGSRGYRHDLDIDGDGVFRATGGYRNITMVVPSAKAKVKGAGEDLLKVGFLLADPGFVYESGVTPVRLRVIEDGDVLVDRTFTELVTGTAVNDGGRTVYKLSRSVGDTATADVVKKFKYKSSNGKGLLILKAATLSGLAPTAAHVAIELTIGERVYFTRVTLFENKPGVYSTKGS